MIGTGLALSARPGVSTMSVGGAMTAQSLGSMQAQEKTAAESQAAFDDQQNQPGITGLAGHVKKFWEIAREAKRPIETQLLEAMYARRGEYTPEKASLIKAAGQPAIYMMLAATKMRQAEALLRDVMIGAGTDKPWTLDPEPVPDLPPMEVANIKASVTEQLTAMIQAGGQPSMDDVRQQLTDMHATLLNKLREDAVTMCTRMEDKMETQLDEGGFMPALDEFITDLTTFKAAFLAGPIVRNKPQLKWVAGSDVPVVKMTQTMEWERVDPFDIFPAPWARKIEEGPLIRKHKLTREALTEMLGVDGFSDDGIHRVLELYGTSGLSNDWLSIDSLKARAEGKLTASAVINTGLIDALQYWGSVSGRMLRDWGMTAKAVPDQSKEYQVEVWMIGPFVIKSVLNADPLARRGIYSSSYERVPGSVWGNSVYDLMQDCADMCNAAARSLAANLGISSGPQVVVNVSRIPTGETITQMYPWKIWQVEEDPMGGVAPPITFFQPSSNAAELMGVYEKFSAMADEYTGVPKYTTGVEGTPGAGRTSSGLSMMLGNASKMIKQVVAAADAGVIAPAVGRLYYHNMRWGTDKDLKGAVNVIARGAMSLTTKDAAQLRRNEFLQATNNPTDMQIIGLEGRAEVLRSAARTLDLNPDKIVPPASVVKAKQAAMQQVQTAQAAEAQGSPGAPGAPNSGAPQQLAAPGGARLDNGAPVTNHFLPAAQP